MISKKEKCRTVLIIEMLKGRVRERKRIKKLLNSQKKDNE